LGHKGRENLDSFEFRVLGFEFWVFGHRDPRRGVERSREREVRSPKVRKFGGGREKSGVRSPKVRESGSREREVGSPKVWRRREKSGVRSPKVRKSGVGREKSGVRSPKVRESGVGSWGPIRKPSIAWAFSFSETLWAAGKMDMTISRHSTIPEGKCSRSLKVVANDNLFWNYTPFI
jgi:hypothetical protein